MLAFVRIGNHGVLGEDVELKKDIPGRMRDDWYLYAMLGKDPRWTRQESEVLQRCRPFGGELMTKEEKERGGKSYYERRKRERESDRFISL